MIVTCDQLSNPIDPRKENTLRLLAQVLARCDIRGTIIGAFARDLFFYHLHGVEIAPRVTADLDITVQMGSWSAYNDLSTALKKVGFTVPDPVQNPQKHVLPNGEEVDLLPYGNISADGQTLEWPGSSLWSVLGFQECAEKARILLLEDDLTLSFATPAAVVALKMIAIYCDPQLRGTKDTQDLGYIFSHYLQIPGNAERLSSEGAEADIMGMVQGDINLASVRLMGRDVADMILEATRKRLLEILAIEVDSRSRCEIAHRLQRFYGGSFSRARAILGQFRDGIRDRFIPAER